MKIHLRFLLACLLCISTAFAVYADPISELIEQLPFGRINWTQALASATGNSRGESFIQESELRSTQEKPYDIAYRQAIQHLVRTLSQLRMSHQSCVANLVTSQKLAPSKIEEMVAGAKVVQQTQLADGSVDVTVEMSLHGGFAQLMLPSDIRQVEPIKPLNGQRTATNPQNPTGAFDEPAARTQADAYSGLVIDARGVGARPSMVPVLLDESGQEVYGPAYVSREFAVQRGMCGYIRGMDDSANLPRVAPNPLFVKGLRTVSKGSCDIVISNADASKLRGASSHLEFLKQCRVVIVLD
jgi:hypothetical protein